MDLKPETVLTVAAVGALAYTCMNKKKEPTPFVVGGKKSKPKRKSAKKSKPKRKSVKKSKPKRKSANKSTKKPKSNSKLGCVDLCKKGTASQQKKYCNRNSPPYPAAVCFENNIGSMRGNDGNMYYANKAGRWSKV